MTAYLNAQIDAELHTWAKVEAAKRGLTVKQIVEAALAFMRSEPERLPKPKPKPK